MEFWTELSQIEIVSIPVCSKLTNYIIYIGNVGQFVSWLSDLNYLLLSRKGRVNSRCSCLK